jgi:uncharacterized membrane protein
MPSSKWLIGALVISLVANLVLAGFLLGRTTSHAGPTRIGPDPAAMYFRLMGFLPEQRREELMPVVRRHLDDIRPQIRETRQRLRGMFEALVADPFDADTLAAEMAELRRLHAITQAESHRYFVELVSAMSHDERQAMAEAMRRPGPQLGRSNDGERGDERRRESRRE